LNSNDIATSHCAAASLLQAPLCPQSLAGAIDKQPSQKALENDTPDAIGDCRPCGPQSQHWRGFPATTASREADHRATTTNVTH
jgi:hypothetical protein